MAFVERIEAELDDCGFGLWAVEVRGEAPFVGYVGLHRVAFEAPFTPAVEVGSGIASGATSCTGSRPTSVRAMTGADSTPEAVAREYFRRMQSGEPVAELFTDDGELIGLGARVSGRDAIRAFYATARSDASPRPEPLTVVALGDRVLAEAYIHLASGERMHVVDGFDVRDGLIRSLTYFTADYPDA